MQGTSIKVRYSSVDGYGVTWSGKTVAGARRWAQKWIGETPDCGRSYAVSDDGVGKIVPRQGCTLRDLFPKAFPVEG